MSAKVHEERCPILPGFQRGAGKVGEWPTYNENLRRCGDMMVWVNDAPLSEWSASLGASRGGQPKYSDLAIAIPDFSALSRQGRELVLPSMRPGTRASGPVHLAEDSTGLRVFGAGAWLQNKRKIKV